MPRWVVYGLERLRMLRTSLAAIARGRDRAPATPVVEAKRLASARPPARPEPAGAAKALTPMNRDQVRDARQSLRRILDCHPAAAVVWPSIAVVDRAMGKYAGAGIDRLPPKVLHDAVNVLNRLMNELSDLGIIVLLERMERVLRVRHGCPSGGETRWRAVRPAEVQVLEATITQFMEIDRQWDEVLLAEQVGMAANAAS